jgi:hypothetical protein
MGTKRLTIELSTNQYEILQKQSKAIGTTISGLIRKLIEELHLRPAEEARKDYQNDPVYKRRGSFDGPEDLAEYHDRYLY